ncbi:MAG TPA: alpha/beta fold hydrolase [Thermoanaerobaculia bacterium]|nr:alpha/beta fold hydrolase [Thermoanaerobaculia bacterium]
MTEMTRVLIVPGLWNSGPHHWQSVWSAAEPGFRRVEQTEWESPACGDWVAALEAAVADAGPQVVIAAHSLGCVTVAHWAAETGLKIHGAFLVAPADVEGLIYPKGPTGFRPMPMATLPFPSILVASEDDPWIKPSRARQLAEAWGSRLVNIGAAGHVNTESGHGPWPEGRRLLDELLLG